MKITSAPSPLAEPSAWHSELRLPLVTNDAELCDIQIMLGGIHLILSRLHPKFGRSRFTSTEALAQRLTRALEYADPGKGLISSEHLRLSLIECEKSLDPGTLMIFKKMLAQALKDEAAQDRAGSQPDFTYSDFMAEDQMLNSFPSHTKGMIAVMA